MRESPPKILSGLLALLALFLLAGLLIYLEKPTGSVTGQVRTEDGKPIPKARVELDAYPRSKKAFSDSKGFFRFEQVPLAEYYVNVSAKGYQPYYFDHSQKIEEGKIRDLGTIALKELEPSLSVSVWSQTKTPDESINLSLSGAKVRKVQFSAYRLDLVQYLKSGGKIEDLEKGDLDPKTVAGAQSVRDWEEEIPEDQVPEFDRKARTDLKDPGLYLIHALASSLDRKTVFTHNILVNKTDLGFVEKRDETRLIVFASGFMKPAPVGGAQVYLFDSTGQSQSFTTSPEGLAEANLASSSLKTSETMTVVVVSGNSVAYSNAPRASTSSEDYGDEGEGDEEGGGGDSSVAKDYHVFLYTERPLYRPAQKVYFKGIVRKENREGRYDPVEPQEVQIRVENPKGDSIFETTTKTNSYGSFWGEFDLDEEADLGYYNLVATVAGREFKKDLEVDEYRKPEFKAEIKTDKPRYFAGEKINFLIDTQYYFGAPVEAEVSYTLYKNSFSDYSEYGDEYGGYGEVAEEGKAKTDAQGRLNLSLKTSANETDQNYVLRITAKDMTEKTVTTEASVLVTAGDFYFTTEKTEFLGLPKKPYSLTVITRDWDKKPVSRDFKIAVEREKYDPIAGDYDYKKVTTVEGKTEANGEGKASLTMDQGGYYRLAISGKDPGGRKVLSYDYLWIAGSAQDSEDYGFEKALKVVVDKKKYEAGEKAKVLIVGPIKGGTAWVTVEGARIHEHYPVKLEGFSKNLEIPLKKDWVPNVYVSAVMIGKKEIYEGSEEIGISPKENYLNVKIEPDAAKYHPADGITYRVTTTDVTGKPVPAEVSLGVVDESLYALRADSTDIKNFFWGSRPNRVRMSYSFSGYYTGGIDKDDQNLLRRNFKDTAYWVPAVETDAQGRATVNFKLPDNLTTWRATVLAQTLSTSVGQEINKVISSKDLIVRLATPRFFTERDRTTLKAIVHNYTDRDQTLNVSLGLEGIDFADPKDNQGRTLTVGPQKAVSFDFIVLPKIPGSAKVQLLAKNESVSDGVELKIPVLAHGMEEHQYAQGEASGGVPGGEGISTSARLTLPPSTDPNHTKLKVSLDTTFVAQLLGSLSYLVDYPYGCVEQTLSRMLPALMVSHLYQSLELTDPMLEKKIPQVISKSLKRLIRMQHADGGWGWWKEDETDPFMTAYAMYGLTRAAQMGEKVNANVLEEGKKALEEQLKKGLPAHFQQGSDRDDLLYFIHYAASLAGIKTKPPLPGDHPLQTKTAQAFLILALEAQGRHGEAVDRLQAEGLISNLERAAICEKTLCHYSEGSTARWSWRGDGEVTAWALQALITGGSTNQILKDQLVQWLLKNRQGGIWRHTRETAAVLYALSEYAKSLPAAGQGVKAKLSLNGQDLEAVNVTSSHFVRNLSKPKIKVGENTLGIANLTEHSLYYQTDLGYFTQEEDLAASSQGIQVTREYLRLVPGDTNTDGQRTYKASDLKGKTKKGEVIGVRITVKNDEDLSYVVVEDPLPSGFEVIQDVRFDEKAAYFSEETVRDEKVALFMTYLDKGIHIFNFALRPELSGAFHVMPTVGYEMYRPEIKGAGAEARIEVE